MEELKIIENPIFQCTHGDNIKKKQCLKLNQSDEDIHFWFGYSTSLCPDCPTPHLVGAKIAEMEEIISPLLDDEIHNRKKRFTIKEIC